MFVINATDYAPVTPVTPPCDIIPIFIGYKGENHARCLIFDLTDCIEEFGDGGFAISFMRHGDAQPYIVTDTDSLETTAIWEINATDTAVEGYGMVQLQYIVGETVCKTAMYRTITFDSNESAGDVPDPYENLLDQIAAYAVAAQASANAAAQSAANASGEADRIIANTAEVVGDWLDDNIGEISGYVIDKSLTVSDAAADAKVAGDWIRASFITDTASGSVASFPDGADGVPVKDLKVSIVASQSGSGDPAPDNVRPITGWTQANVVRCGKNLFTNPQYGKALDASTGAISSSNNANWVSNIMPMSSDTITYTLTDKGNMGNGSVNIAWYDSTGAYLGFNNAGYFNDTLPAKKTLTKAGASYAIAFGYQAGGATAINTAKIQFEIDTAATAYEAYNGTTYTVSFGSAGTVYGGTLDVTTGVLTVTDAQIASYNGETLPSTWISDRDVYAVGTTPTTGAQVVYKLATPQTFALTPTQVTSLLGNNNIFADCGGSDVTYRADPRLYLEKLTNPDSDMTADANIASGSYFMVGNRLYLATSAIALGATIVPGTNCTATDLASALNAINA